MKRLTVLMPVYNVAPYVSDAIESVLSQTYSDFDLLVLDDCSTDNTADIVKSFKDSRIRLVRNEVNLGLAENLNKGIELADTEFIARMDGDDIACPLWLEKGVATLDSRPEVGICSFGFEFFGDKNSLVRIRLYGNSSRISQEYNGRQWITIRNLGISCRRLFYVVVLLSYYSSV